MEYQEFLNITGATQDAVSEEVFSSQIEPFIQARPAFFLAAAPSRATTSTAA